MTYRKASSPAVDEATHQTIMEKEWIDTNHPWGSLSKTSKNKVLWKCSKNGCEHQWHAAVYERVVRRTGCPACMGRVVTPNNCLSFLHPEIAKQWDYDSKNNAGRSPKTITAKTSFKAAWVCDEQDCGHRWQRQVAQRTNYRKQGCPACAGRVANSSNSLRALFPAVAAQWDDKRSTPEEVRPGSGMKAWWRCNNETEQGACNHRWQARVASRTYAEQPTSCPACSSSGFKNNLPGFVYLLSHQDGYFKIGISNVLSRRLQTHARNGYKLLQYWSLERGHDAHSIERSVVMWWRQTLKLEAAVLEGDGHTETVSSSRITATEIVSFVEKQIENMD